MQSKITQAVILAAGLGTRLRPLTNTVPKVMIPVAGRPLLENTVLWLKSQGITDFVFNLYYLPDQIKNHFGDGSEFGVRIRYSDETENLLETAGAIKKMEPMLDPDFLFMYGDLVHEFDFAPLISLHVAHQAIATTTLKRSGVPEEGDLVRADSNGKIAEWIARPHDLHDFGEDLYLNGGLYVLSKKITDFIPADRPVKLDGETIPLLLERQLPVYGLTTNVPILDTGTPERYAIADAWLKSKRGTH